MTGFIDSAEKKRHWVVDGLIRTFGKKEEARRNARVGLGTNKYLHGGPRSEREENPRYKATRKITEVKYWAL